MPLFGVKGTEFILATGAEETSLLTLSGSVVFASVSAPDVEVVVTENQVSQIRQDSKPTASCHSSSETQGNYRSRRQW